MSFELRCGSCHSTPSFPSGDRAREALLGELYVSPNFHWMAWTGPYRHAAEQINNVLPGPRRARPGDPGTTWRPVPREGIRHHCRAAGHHMALTESQLWTLVRAVSSTASILYLPATAPRHLRREATQPS